MHFRHYNKFVKDTGIILVAQALTNEHATVGPHYPKQYSFAKPSIDLISHCMRGQMSPFPSHPNQGR